MSVPHALKAGAVIAGYDIVRVLGAGGFGITYEAASAITGKRVAIKEFFPRGIASRDNATRIIFDEKEDEVVAWALKRFESSTTDQCRLKHPNIVEVLHYVKDNGTGYMIMEYVEGQTLEHWLRARKNPPTPAELRPLIEPVLSALEYLHGLKLIHRDIAPDNIMVRSDGKPMIIDFGALKLIEQQTQVRSKTNRSFMVSKQFYSPPEQVEEDGDLDHRADIYAVAATMYRSFAGKPPIGAETRTQKIARTKNDPYVPLGESAPSLDKGVAAAIDVAMSYDPDVRTRSIPEFIDALGWNAAQEPTVAAPRPAEQPKRQATAMPDYAPPVLTPKESKSPLRWLIPLGGVAAVAAIVLLAFNPSGQKPAEVAVTQPAPKQEVTKAPPPRVETPVAPPKQVTPPAPKVETPVAPPKVETPPPPAKVETPPPPKADPLESARRDFEAVQRVNTTEAYEQFLRQYPEGLYATLAREAIKRAAMLDSAKLNRALNAELKRVGCGTGASDGNWGDDSERALALFNQHAQTKLNTKLASADALDAVRAKTQRVCPLICGPNQRVQGNACVAAPPPPGAKQNEQKKQAEPGGRWCLIHVGVHYPVCSFTSEAQCNVARSDPRARCIRTGH